jgi:enamine deaminase RidA (YjgF/YER057c/UK114 family)
MITDRIDPPELLRIPEIVNVSIATGTRIVHISGQTAVDINGKVVATTHLEQSRVAFRNVLIALDAAGASLADVAKLNIYMVDYSWDALEQLMAAAKEILGDPYPLAANTQVGVASLWLPELLGRNRRRRHHLSDGRRRRPPDAVTASSLFIGLASRA